MQNVTYQNVLEALFSSNPDQQTHLLIRLNHMQSSQKFDAILREMVRQKHICISIISKKRNNNIQKNHQSCLRKGMIYKKITSQEVEGSISGSNFDSMVGVFQHHMAHQFFCICRS